MLSKNLRLILGMILVNLCLACQNNNVYFTEYKTYPKAWPKQEPAEFNFSAPDTTQAYDVFIMLRNNEDYAYRNLFLISSINFPNGKVIVDTLEYEMTYPNGEFMGQGGSIKTNKLWLKEAVKFTEDGKYTLKIKQSMRKFGKIEALERLKGITDVGIQIEKHNTLNDN